MKLWFWTSFWMAGCLAASAGLVFFDDNTKSLHVMGYPEAVPATPALLLQLDRLHGWNKMSFDVDQNRYVLDASLVIGFNDGGETFFQVGGAQTSNETLLVRGDVVVYPVHIQKQNIDLSSRVIPPGRNRLTLGAADAIGHGGTVLIESSTNTAHTLYVGFVPGDEPGATLSGPGAELHAYNSVMAAAQTAPEGAMAVASARRSGGTPGVRLGADPVLINSRISRADGYFLASLGRNARVEGTTFEYGQAGLYNCWSVNPVVGCTFRNLDAAVRDGGSIVLTMIDCVFENNRHNWALTHSDRALTLIDCEWQAPATGDVYRCWDNPRTGKRQYPCVVSYRHISVAVVDAENRPVANAAVYVENEQGEWDAAEPPRLRVNDRGATPGRGEKNALRLKEFVRRATDTENAPETTEYTYKITVKADGFVDKVITGYQPDKSWEILRIEI